MLSLITPSVLLLGLVIVCDAGKVNLYRYYQGSVYDHFYTTNAAEIGTTTPGQIGNNGYTFEGIACQLETDTVLGSVELYRYYQGSVYDHLYTTNAAEIGTITLGQTGNNGYVFEGIVGNCFNTVNTV